MAASRWRWPVHFPADDSVGDWPVLQLREAVAALVPAAERAAQQVSVGRGPRTAEFPSLPTQSSEWAERQGECARLALLKVSECAPQQSTVSSDQSGPEW
jgi:hypothetical protein